MRVQLLSNTAFGNIGDVVEVGPGMGEAMIRNRDARVVAVEVENKALAPEAPVKRGPGRPRKVLADNKAVGA